MPEKVLITGGTGLVGTQLSKLFTEKGYEVALLSRNPKDKKNTYKWDIEKGEIDPAALEGTTAIIHLAGANVGEGAWTSKRKKEILDSRIKSANLLIDALKKQNHSVHSFISASATGYYGDTGAKWVTEDAQPAADDFLAEVCVKWEESVAPIAELGIRLVKLRIGVVLTKEGGALPKLLTPVKFFAGAPLGDGSQFLPWIHINDLVKIVEYTLDNAEVNGVFNAVAPNPVTNEEITKAIGSQLGRPIWPISVPSFALKLALGEMSEIVLSGTKASSEKLQKTGFAFQFSTIEIALKDLL